MVDRRRRWRAENQDISIVRRNDDGTYLVRGTRGIEYTAELTEPTCDCPDWVKRTPDGGCKHILKAKLEKGLIDPLPSARTDFGSWEDRWTGEYDPSWEAMRKQTRERDDWTCQSCGAEGGLSGGARLETHHIVPKSRGGEDRAENLITLCHSCHESEHGHSIPSGGDGQPSTSGSHVSRPPDLLKRTAEARESRASRPGQRHSSGDSDEDTPLDPYGRLKPSLDAHQRGYRNRNPEGDRGRHREPDDDPEDTTAGQDTGLSTSIPTDTGSPSPDEPSDTTDRDTGTKQSEPNVGTDQTEAPDQTPGEEDRLGVIDGVAICLIVGLILVVLVPPFLTVTDWKAAFSLFAVGVLFAAQGIADAADHSLATAIRDSIEVALFAGGGIYIISST